MEKNKKLIIALVVVLILLILIGGYFLYKNRLQKSKPDTNTPEGRLELLKQLEATSSKDITLDERAETLQKLDSTANTSTNTNTTTKEDRLKLLDSLGKK